jgi:Ca2+-binding RTX toxin-like protein
MATYQEYARLSAYVYGGASRPPLPSGWSSVMGTDGRPLEAAGQSGYYGAVFHNASTGEYVLASRGTELGDPGDRRAAWALATANVPRAQLRDAQELVGRATAAGVPVEDLTYTGHSLGGSLAQLLSTGDGRPAVTFNAAPVRNLLPELGRDPNVDYPIADVVDPADIVSQRGPHVGTRIELAGSLFPLSLELLLLSGMPPVAAVHGLLAFRKAHSIDNVVEKLGVARSLIPCPIVVDLDGDGIETTATSGASFFDHNADGFAERTGWVAADDGLLVQDRNGNGRIDTGRELLGNHTLRATGVEATNGYQALADLDANGDGKVDASDPGFSGLRIWRDGDRDGSSTPAELHTLASLNIRSLATSFTETAVTDAQGNAHRQVSTYTRTDGSQRVTADVWFSSTPSNTVAASFVPVPGRLAGLPEGVGFGTVRDLSQAMAMDQSGALEGLVRVFMAQPDPTQRSVILEQLLFEWTGSAHIDPTSRGPVIDARRLAVLEAFSGEPFVGGWGSNPAAPAQAMLLEAYSELREAVYAELVIQTHLKPLYDRITYQWDPVAGVARGDLSGVATELETRLAQDPAGGRLLAAEFARSIRAFDAEDATDYWAFRDRLGSVAPDLPWLMDSAGRHLTAGTSAGELLTGTNDADGLQGGAGDDTINGGVNADVIYGDAGADLLTGDDGDDHVVGGADNDQLFGGLGEDRLEGGAGNDDLSGESGDDVLVGGTGDDRLFGNDGNDVLMTSPGVDTLDGGRGNDVYVLSRIPSQTIVKDNDWAFPNTDIVRVEAGIVPADVAVSRDGVDLVLRVAGTIGEMRLYWWFNEGFGYEYQVQRVEFGDGTVWTIDTIKDILTRGSEGADNLIGFGTDDVLRGLGGDDTLAGSSGSDRLEGGSGNDTLYGETGNDTLVGGADTDTLDGGLDNDTYVFGRGSGRDTIYDNDWWRPATDRILFEAGVAPGDVSRTRDGNDLVLRINATGDELRLHWWFLDGFGYTYQVQEARFADGTIWDLATLQQVGSQGTAGPDTLQGTASADILEGFAGNDTLLGLGGDDRLDGGADADTLRGGPGNDSYAVDNAQDAVVEMAGEGADTVLSSIGYTLSANVENLVLTGTAAINATGNALANTLTGNSGANVLDGGAGADSMSGGAGNDTYRIDNAGDVVSEAAGMGVDSVSSSISYTLGANVENLTLTGSASINAIGNALANVLQGNAGPNVLNGGAGVDTMRGGGGNDTYVVDNAGDVVFENASEGTDTVQAGISYVLGANQENLVLTGAGSISGTGNGLANTLTGNGGPNTLAGAGGPDTLLGAGGSDAYVVGWGSGADRIIENDSTPGSADTLLFQSGIRPIDIVLSRSGNNLLLALASASDVVTVQDWYQGSAQRVELVRAGATSVLAASQVDQLIQAMATYSSVSGLSWADAARLRPAEVESVLAAYWQSTSGVPGT